MGYDRMDLRGLILRLCCFALLLSACSPAGAAAQPTATPSPTIFPGQVSNPLFSGTETSPSRIYAKGAWKLYIYYRLKGTRSEGQHGVLYQDGEEVKFGQPGITLQTELGEMKYYLNPEDMKVLWDTTGWNFADSGLIKGWDK